MNKRLDPFANIAEAPVFTPKPKKEAPVDSETVERLAEQNNFPSRQAKPASTPRRKPRIYRTGRNQPFNAKVTPETLQRIYKLAADKNVVLGELLKQAMDALETLDSLQKVADDRDMSLQELVSQAVDAIDGRKVAR